MRIKLLDGATMLGAVIGSGMVGGMASGGVLDTGNALLGGQTFGGAVEAGIQGAVTGAVSAGAGYGLAKGVEALAPLFRRGLGSGDLALTRAMNDGSGRTVDEVLEGGIDAAKGVKTTLHGAESLLMDFHARYYYDAQLGRWHNMNSADQAHLIGDEFGVLIIFCS